MDYNLIQGKIALNLWCIRHNAVRVFNLTNQSTGRFVFHLVLLPLVREPGDQASFVLSLVEIGPVVLEEKIFLFCQCILAFS